MDSNEKMRGKKYHGGVVGHTRVIRVLSGSSFTFPFYTRRTGVVVEICTRKNSVYFLFRLLRTGAFRPSFGGGPFSAYLTVTNSFFVGNNNNCVQCACCTRLTTMLNDTRINNHSASSYY